MGFCSGTDIFDSVVGFVLNASLTDGMKINIIQRLIEALEDHDWDCQSDSAYYDHPLIQRIFKLMHPDWFEEDKTP